LRFFTEKNSSKDSVRRPAARQEPPFNAADLSHRLLRQPPSCRWARREPSSPALGQPHGPAGPAQRRGHRRHGRCPRRVGARPPSTPGTATRVGPQRGHPRLALQHPPADLRPWPVPLRGGSSHRRRAAGTSRLPHTGELPSAFSPRRAGLGEQPGFRRVPCLQGFLHPDHIPSPNQPQDPVPLREVPAPSPTITLCPALLLLRPELHTLYNA